jgi:sec-independent protein translocase protein TatA
MNAYFAMLGLSGGELILIAVVALVLFGANKIPTFMKGLGQGIKEFKKASGDVQNELERAMHEEPPRRPTPAPAAPAPAAPASAAAPAPAPKA